eukprot:symbB.v1.2.034519.t1/scaffold4471.1/size51619/3
MSQTAHSAAMRLHCMVAHVVGASLLALTLWHRSRSRTLAASRTRVEGSVRWQLHPCAFFRPEAEPARQLGVLAAILLRQERGYLSVLELFAGSGLRSARYLAEGTADFVWANEANQDVYPALVANLASVANDHMRSCKDLLSEWAAPARSWSLQEGLPLHGCEGGAHPGWQSVDCDKDSGREAEGWRITHWEARALLGYCHGVHRQFDLVDVDAFGCWGHVKDTLEVVRPGGLLYLTATGLTSWKPLRAFHRLGLRLGRCPPQETLHDQMCRALVWHVVALADHLSLAAEPLFTHYRQNGDVYRIMFRVKRRFGESQLRPQMVGLCRSCHCLLGPWEEDLVLSVHRPTCDCGSSEVAFWGPVWTNQLQSDVYLEKLQNLWQSLSKGSDEASESVKREGFKELLTTLRLETVESGLLRPWTLRLSEVAKRAKEAPVKMEKLLEQIGFQFLLPMASHSFRPRRVEDWFDAVPNLLSDLDWDMEVEKPQASLSHCDCPWGDKLIRVTVAGITVQDPPVKKSHVLVRPEIRAALASSLVHQGEPGDAVVQRFADWGLLRLCRRQGILFILFCSFFVDKL